MVKVYLERLSSYSAEKVRCEFNKIKEHFISVDENELSNSLESLLGKILLHSCLCDMGVKDYTAEYQKNKKPVLKCHRALYFNISHSGDYVVLAVSDSEVGCDVQELKEYNPKVAKRCYCDKETELIELSENKKDIFISLWALKESILKFKGDGVSGGLGTYDFSDYYGKDDFKAYGCYFTVRQLDNAYFALCHKDDNVTFVTKEKI